MKSLYIDGNYVAAYKNIFDWASRVKQEVYQDKPIIMLSTSPGPGGAKSVLNLARESAKFFNGQVLSALSIPSFYENFDVMTNKLSNPELDTSLKVMLKK